MLGKYNKDTEKQISEDWLNSNLYKFDENAKGEIYSIDTPPPFTSGQLHMGHVLSYSFFDFVARFKRMQGFNVYYLQGWDTQGFPTEVKVEKKFGRLPREEFRQKCVEWTNKYIEVMKDEMNELGFSPDWALEYRTMDPDYHKKVQSSLLKMHKDGLVYRGKHPVFWCSRCSSAIAKAETEDAKKNGILNNIIFKGPNGEDLEIATTRPELMHACVAVMFHPDDERYKHLNGKTIETALGKKVKAIPDKDVKMDFGTGLLMVCTFGDVQDVVWAKRHDLELIDAIDHRGKLINAGELDGLKVEEARKKIIEKLKQTGKITKQTQLEQTYKVHDRCKRPIELKNSLQWFAKIKEFKEDIKNLAKGIKWHPEFGIHYLTDWADNVDWDWCISRHRVFGTPLPFYVCESCEYSEPANEDELPFYPGKIKERKCSKCDVNLVGEITVADCWIDSSITPLIISRWGEDETFFKRTYPIDLRPQGVEIVRTWAFYTIYRSGFLTNKTPPFKNVLLNGNVLATDGKKMSKSLGNVISLPDLKQKYPIDAMRQWAALSGAMAKDRPFSYEDLNRSKSFILKLWNSAKFLEQFMQVDERPDASKLKLIDRWILTKLNNLIQKCTNHMEKFEFHSSISAIHKFYWSDFCDNYLEYVKYRVYNDKDKSQAQTALFGVLENSLKLLAPFMVFTTEAIYKELFSKGESIHKQSWPKKFPITELNEKEQEWLDLFNEIVSQVRQHKANNRMSQAAELEKVTISIKEDLAEELIEELKMILKIKEIDVKFAQDSLNIIFE